jgi:hypothetical protein
MPHDAHTWYVVADGAAGEEWVVDPGVSFVQEELQGPALVLTITINSLDYGFEAVCTNMAGCEVAVVHVESATAQLRDVKAILRDLLREWELKLIAADGNILHDGDLPLEALLSKQRDLKPIVRVADSTTTHRVGRSGVSTSTLAQRTNATILRKSVASSVNTLNTRRVLMHSCDVSLPPRRCRRNRP